MEINKIFYTKNISTKDYTTLILMCIAKNKTEAFYKFRDYINNNIKISNIYFNKSLIRELTKEVKEFYFSE